MAQTQSLAQLTWALMTGLKITVWTFLLGLNLGLQDPPPFWVSEPWPQPEWEQLPKSADLGSETCSRRSFSQCRSNLGLNPVSLEGAVLKEVLHLSGELENGNCDH